MTITISPNEKSTAVVTFSFTDEAGVTAVPTTAAWQLMNAKGEIINSRSFENCSFSGNDVVLSGDDLAIFGATDSGKRIIAFQGTYNSNIGVALPLNDEYVFRIDKLVSQVDEI